MYLQKGDARPCFSRRVRLNLSAKEKFFSKLKLSTYWANPSTVECCYCLLCFPLLSVVEYSQQVQGYQHLQKHCRHGLPGNNTLDHTIQSLGSLKACWRATGIVIRGCRITKVNNAGWRARKVAIIGGLATSVAIITLRDFSISSKILVSVQFQHSVLFILIGMKSRADIQFTNSSTVVAYICSHYAAHITITKRSIIIYATRKGRLLS